MKVLEIIEIDILFFGLSLSLLLLMLKLMLMDCCAGAATRHSVPQ